MKKFKTSKLVFFSSALLSLLVSMGCKQKSPADHYKSVESKSIENGLNSMKTNFSETKKLADGFKEDMAFKLILSDEGRNMLSGLASMQGLEMDLSWLKEINLDCDFIFKDKSLLTQSNLTLNDAKVNFDFAMNDEMLVGCLKELNPKYLYGRYEDGNFSDEDLEVLKNWPSNYSMILKSLPEYAEFQKSVKGYTDVWFKYATNVEREEKYPLEVGGIKQDVTKFVVTIENEQLKNLVSEETQLLKNDTSIKNFLDGLSQYNSAYASLGLYSSFTGAIEDIVEGLEDADFSDTKLVVTVYADSSNNICGRSISVNDEEFFNYNLAKDSGKFALDSSLSFDGSAITLEGSGTEKGNIYSGDFSIAETSNQIDLAFTLDKLDAGALAKGELDCELSFSNPTLEMMNLSASAKLKSKGSKANYEVALSQANAALITFKSDIGISSCSSIKLPEGQVNAFDEDALNTYISEFDWDNVKKIIRLTGLPEDYCLMADSALDNLAEELSYGL